MPVLHCVCGAGGVSLAPGPDVMAGTGDQPAKKVKVGGAMTTHVPTEDTRRQVSLCMTFGMTRAQIGMLLGVTDETIHKHYRKEVDVGKHGMTMNVANNLYNIATDPEHKNAATAAIFWMKAQGGWREVVRTEVTGADGGALQIETSPIDSRALSHDQRQALREILEVAISDRAQVIQGSSRAVDE